MIPGAPLSWLWEHPKDGFMEEPFQLYSKALPEFPWDVLSLQPFARHLDGTDGDLTAERNQGRCKGDGAGLAQLDDNEMGIQARAAQAGILAGGLPADGWGDALQEMQYQL
jgi:hypothetical protein